MRYGSVFLACLVLGACGSGAPVSQSGGLAMADSCDARGQRGLVGAVPRDLAGLSLVAPKVRFINPGDAVAQDAQPDRLNIVFDDAGAVTEVYCG
ncbi:MAG: I78 family peptidase inhibitor [Pseudomonadota bacterium]